MKKIFSIISLVAGIVGMSSCSDFLDQTSPSEQSDETVYNSTYYTGLRVNQVYGSLGKDETYSQYLGFVWHLNSDIELVDGLGSTATSPTHYRGAMNYNASPAWTDIAKCWTAMYGAIEDANLNIANIRTSSLLTAGGEDQRAMERYLGESLTLRAMLYFDLIRLFGDIPLKLEPSLADLSNAYLPKTDRDEIMDVLMEDLEEAVELLPWADDVTGYTTEHATKGYAHALLAQIAMTRAGYAIREKAKDGYETADYTDETYPTQRPGAEERKALYEKALKHLTAIITSGKHSLNPSFGNEWYLINQLTLDQAYHENIFEIPMGLDATGELGYRVGVRLNSITSEYGYSNSSGMVKVTAPLLYSYDPNDTRRDITCSHMEIKQDGSLTKEFMLGNAPFGIYVGKWDPRKMTDTWLSQNFVASTKHMTGINPVKVRYANVLLWFAEAMNELYGPTAVNSDCGKSAYDALAEVHNRAFTKNTGTDEKPVLVPNPQDNNEFLTTAKGSKNAMFDAIVQENAWEFAGEGFRKYELIRWNLLAEKIMEFKETYLRQLEDGTYQEKIYYNYLDAAQSKLDMSSVTWYGIPTGKSASDYQGSSDSFGKNNDTQVNTNLPSICGGLVGDDVPVKNRYLIPIGSTTISAANGSLHNSYGYNDY